MLEGGENIMIFRVLGAILIVLGCGGFGMMICFTYKREEEMLRQLIHALDFIQCELKFRLTPLPELCAGASSVCKGTISRYFHLLSQELASQNSPDVRTCTKSAKASMGNLPARLDKAFELLDLSLGQLDAQGQILALDTLRDHCRTELASMSENRESRLRSYQTLGICAGAALVILLV